MADWGQNQQNYKNLVDVTVESLDSPLLSLLLASFLGGFRRLGWSFHHFYVLQTNSGVN